MAMPTVEALPIQASLTLKSTFTRGPSRETLVTSPTFTPAIRTSSPWERPADSVKSALYVVPPPMKGRESARQAVRARRVRTRSPTTATATGLRSRMGVRVMPGTSAG